MPETVPATHNLVRSFYRICDEDQLLDIKVRHPRHTGATLLKNLGVPPRDAHHSWPPAAGYHVGDPHPRGSPGPASSAWPYQRGTRARQRPPTVDTADRE